MARASKEPYYITVLRNVQKHYPGYSWSTEQRQLDGVWTRTLSGRRGSFILAVEVPNRPMLVNDLEGQPQAFWRAAAELIIRKINEGEHTYGQIPAIPKQNNTGKTDILLRSEAPGGNDGGRKMGKDGSTGTDGNGEPPKVRR